MPVLRAKRKVVSQYWPPTLLSRHTIFSGMSMSFKVFESAESVTEIRNLNQSSSLSSSKVRLGECSRQSRMNCRCQVLLAHSSGMPR